MDGTTDGSSGAARRAQDGDEPSEQGFFSRIMDALSPGDSREDGGGIAGSLPSVREQVHGMLNLSRMHVDEVAIPKAEIMAVPDDIARDDLVRVFRDSGLSRLPVYSGTLDTPVGMIHLKDIALKYGFDGNGSGNGEFAIADLVRPLLYAPPSMPVGELLQRMRRGRIHMALIIDEYGGVDGLVTIENLIEIVIGQIEDEHDLDEGKLWTLEEEGRYLVEARTSLKSFREETGVDLTKDLDDEEIDTLGGLVFVLSGRVPARGEIIRHPADIDFEVVDADVRRIKRLRVHLGKPGRG